eukprot:scaffold39158_cov71-Phaeocystis_antarctica.AAC.2
MALGVICGRLPHCVALLRRLKKTGRQSHITRASWAYRRVPYGTIVPRSTNCVSPGPPWPVTPAATAAVLLIRYSEM